MKENPAGALPLMVLVQSENYVAPVNAWIKEEMAALSHKQIGLAQVTSLTQSGSSDTSPQILQDAIIWLAKNSQRQPQLMVRY